MSVMETKQQQQERKRRQAELKKELRQRPTPLPTEEVTGQQAPPALTDANSRRAQWQGCCKLACNAHRDPMKWERLQANLHSVPVDDQRLMPAAVALVLGMAAAGVRRWDFLPVPSDDELSEPSAWAGRRLSARRAEQDEAGRDHQFRQQVARAFGQSAAGNGNGTPVYAQRLSRPLAEAGDPLKRVMAQHQTKHGEFRSEWLDPNSRYFIAGITNKEIIMMASEISGSRSRRSFEQNWKIVADWLRWERQAVPVEA